MPHTPNQLDRRFLLTSAVAVAAAAAWSPALAADVWAASPFRKLTDAQWKARLPGEAYVVLRHEGTETAFTSPLLGEHRTGTFACLGCGLPLFKSQWKFDSGTGWPSFYTAIAGSLIKKTDLALGIPRTEYHCARCLGHQGHVFDDGPKPTGLRYCNDGVALKFTAA
jgi:peptide-methionine (R)-S-oxide reductase